MKMKMMKKNKMNNIINFNKIQMMKKNKMMKMKKMNLKFIKNDIFFYIYYIFDLCLS